MKTALAVVANEADQIPSPVVPYVETNPVSVLLDEYLRGRFFAEIETEIKEFTPDLSTVTSRKEIASLAYKVARTKTAIDAAGKKLNEDRRKQINAVDEVRRECKTVLETLQDRARKPLDEWEAAEKEREDKIKAKLDFLDNAIRVLAIDTYETISARIIAVELIPDNEDFRDARARTLEVLNAAHARLLKEEDDRAELARLRAADAERERQEEALRRAEAAKLADERREKEEAERKDREEKAAQERIQAAEKRAADEAIAAERRAAEQAAAKAKAEADAEIARLNVDKRKMEQAEEARKAEEKRLAVEEERRQNDRDHMAKVMTAAKEAFMDETGLDEATSKKIVRLISFGKIPNVSIRF